MSPLHHLTRHALLGLATALSTGRLGDPMSSMSLAEHVPVKLCDPVATELNRLAQAGMKPQHLAYLLRSIAEERELAQSQRDRINLVWTGQETSGSASRDTRIVAQELFSNAQHSVLIASYALDKGAKARELFQILADRMDNQPLLQARMFLNVQRSRGDRRPDSVLLRTFAAEFRKSIWPGERMPEVFHDPRSLSQKPGPKACLHAKCIVIDEERLLITSANFTEAAHERNIEAGVLMVDPVAARAMKSQFETLVTQDILKRVPGL